MFLSFYTATIQHELFKRQPLQRGAFMLTIHSVRHIALQDGDGRHLRYALQPIDVYDNDPFILMADDKFAHNTFADHPHKGIQTVTYVLEGSLTHYDSKTGGGGRLKEGDFQIMTAASGIIHNENPDYGEEARVLQLWVNLSSAHKKLPGQYEDLPKEKVPILHFEGGHVEVLAGEVDGVTSPLTLFTPFQYAAVTLNGSYSFPVSAGYTTYLYVIEGHPTVNGNTLNTFDMVHFETSKTADTIELASEAHAKVVIFSGLPIKEPIVARGPFVMNTDEEIQKAFSSYRNGTFLNGTPY